MAIEGNLAHVGLADICQLLAMGRKVGCLTVSNRPHYGSIYFENGRVTYAFVANRPDRLGGLLVSNGAVTAEQLEAAVETQGREPARRLGEILVDTGSLERAKLEHFISIQIEEAVYHLFAWTEGTFRFEPEERPNEEEVMVVSVNTEGLLLEGARRVDEWGLIEKKIPSLDLIFSVEHLPGEDDDVELTANQERILPLLDGDRTVDDLVDVSGLVEFDTAKALYGLLQAGYVTKTGQRVREPEPVPEPAGGEQGEGLAPAYYRSGMLGDAARELERILEQEPDNADARFKMSVVALKLGRFEDSLSHLDALNAKVGGQPGVLRNRALALEKLGRLDEAEAAFQSALTTNRGDGQAALGLAIVALKRGDAAAARKRLEKARPLLANGGPPPAIFYSYGILVAALQGDFGGAAALGAEGLELHPDESALLVNLGAVEEHLGRDDKAEDLYLKAVAATEPTPQAHKSLGDFAYKRGDYDEARAHFERAVKLDPRLGDDVYQKLGEIAHNDDDHDWALMLWRRALELNPDNETVRSSVDKLEATRDS